MTELVAGIILEGLKIFKEERRYRFKTKYYKTLSKINDLKSEVPPEYTDLEMDELQDELEILLKVFYDELKAHNKELNTR
jgi:hypothetical protein